MNERTIAAALPNTLTRRQVAIGIAMVSRQFGRGLHGAAAQQTIQEIPANRSQ